MHNIVYISYNHPFLLVFVLDRVFPALFLCFSRASPVLLLCILLCILRMPKLASKKERLAAGGGGRAGREEKMATELKKNRTEKSFYGIYREGKIWGYMGVKMHANMPKLR